MRLIPINIHKLAASLVPFVIFCVNTFAQAPILQVNASQPSYSRPSETFESRFNLRLRSDIQIVAGSTISAHRIRRIGVYHPQGPLLQSFDFDTAGTLLSETLHGLHEREYTITTAYSTKVGQDFRYVKLYYRSDTLMRIDTVSYVSVSLPDTGGVCDCGYMKTTSWKLGKLMNEQNAYFNEKYLDKEMNRLNRTAIGIEDYGNSEMVVYLKNRLKTNYEGEVLFHARTSNYCMNSQCVACCPPPIETTHDGEAFNEPIWHNQIGCASSTRLLDSPSTFKMNYNESGLPIEVISFNHYTVWEQYTPPPTKPDSTSIWTGTGTVSVSRPRQIQATKTSESLTARIKYDFFE